MNSNSPLIVKKTYDLLKYLVAHPLRTMPKSQRFELGKRIQDQTTDCLEKFITAYYSPIQKRKELLQQTNISLEILRHYIRLCYDLDFINIKKYEFISQQINEIGRMNGAWLKSLNL